MKDEAAPTQQLGGDVGRRRRRRRVNWGFANWGICCEYCLGGLQSRRSCNLTSLMSPPHFLLALFSMLRRDTMPTKVLTIKLLSLAGGAFTGGDPLTSLDNHSCLPAPCILACYTIHKSLNKEGGWIVLAEQLELLCDDLKQILKIYFFASEFMRCALISQKQRKLVQPPCRISEVICHISTGAICYDKSFLGYTLPDTKVQRGCHGENRTPPKTIMHAACFVELHGSAH